MALQNTKDKIDNAKRSKVKLIKTKKEDMLEKNETQINISLINYFLSRILKCKLYIYTISPLRDNTYVCVHIYIHTHTYTDIYTYTLINKGANKRCNQEKGK